MACTVVRAHRTHGGAIPSRRGLAGLGRARRGEARNKEGEWFFCGSIPQHPRRASAHGRAWLGMAWLGMARQGLARHGLARRGKARLVGVATKKPRKPL